MATLTVTAKAPDAILSGWSLSRSVSLDTHTSTKKGAIKVVVTVMVIVVHVVSVVITVVLVMAVVVIIVLLIMV